ncbi:MAG: MBL fold metallo-hydrolase, partial [Lachnospirales bacterium]
LMELRFSTIASSSKGNCIYIGSEHTNILIDAGVSGKKVEEGLKELNLCGTDIDAIFVTHEHSDHVSGIGVMSRRFNIPVYATEGTWNNMPKSVGAFRRNMERLVYADEVCVFNDLCIKPFNIPHDASEPVGYSVFNDKHKITVATDIGHITDTVKENVKNSSLVLLESNHDVNMVLKGGYPQVLKERILSDFGHLSNDNAGKFLAKGICEKLKYVFLGHLSQDNNTPRIAYDTVSSILADMGAEIGGDFNMWVAPPYGVKRRISLK